MGKLSDATPYLAMAALAATGVGLAGAGGVAATTGAGATAAGAGATGALGTQTGLSLVPTLGSSAAVAPEAAFLAGLGGTSPSVAPLATDVAMSSVFNPSTINPYESMEGVSFLGDAPVKSVGGWEQPFLGQTEFAPVTEKAAGNYAFTGGHESLPQWKQLDGMANVTSYAVEDGTKTLMEKMGIDKSTAFQLASQFYAGSMEAPPNFQGQPVAPTGRQRTYSPSTMAQIMDRTRGNYGRKTRTSRI